MPSMRVHVIISAAYLYVMRIVLRVTRLATRKARAGCMKIQR